MMATAFISAIQAVNGTTDQWRVDPLPGNLTAINGTLSNGTLINGNVYHDGDILGTTVIERVQPSTFGSLTVVSFIYMLMSLLIILFLAAGFTKFVRVALGQRQYEYTLFLPTTATGALTAREFDKQLRRFYPSRSPNVPPPSYAETRPRHPNGDFSSQGLREFRELIRAKYAMDVQVWNFRDAHPLNEPIVAEWRKRSRGATLDMMETVAKWTASREQWSVDEWEQVREIYLRIQQLNEQERARCDALEKQ
jgi:hypothetical protein